MLGLTLRNTLPIAESYAAKTVRNVAWLGGTQFVRQFVAIGTTVVLARFLSPTDYGIFAMTLFVNELAQLFIDFGIGSALVQRKEIDRLTLSTCFWLNLLIGGLVAIAVVAIGPLAAQYFKQPLVAHLLMVSALNLAVAALVVLPQAILSRQLAFNHIAIGTTVGSLVGAGATMILAAGGAGIWSLVLQPLIGTAVNLLYLVWRARWLPSFEFEFASIRGILGFSGHVMVSNVVNHVTRNLQQLIVAPVIGASAMGLLTMATTIAWLPVAQFTAAAVRAIYPVFARLQDSQERVESGLRKTFELVALFAFPSLFGLALLSADLLPVVFGPQWGEAAPLVSVLCLLCLIYSFSFLAGSTLLAKGRADTTMNISLVGLLIVGATLWLVREANILWVTVGLSLSHMGIALLTLHLSLRSIASGWSMLVTALSRPLFCSLGMSLVLWTTRQHWSGMASAARLFALVALGVLVYTILTVLLNRRGLDALLSLARGRRA